MSLCIVGDISALPIAQQSEGQARGGFTEERIVFAFGVIDKDSMESLTFDSGFGGERRGCGQIFQVKLAQ